MKRSKNLAIFLLAGTMVTSGQAQQMRKPPTRRDRRLVDNREANRFRWRARTM
jgi:hypothetical protein